MSRPRIPNIKRSLEVGRRRGRGNQGQQSSHHRRRAPVVGFLDTTKTRLKVVGLLASKHVRQRRHLAPRMRIDRLAYQPSPHRSRDRLQQPTFPESTRTHPGVAERSHSLPQERTHRLGGCRRIPSGPRGDTDATRYRP